MIEKQEPSQAQKLSDAQQRRKLAARRLWTGSPPSAKAGDYQNKLETCAKRIGGSRRHHTTLGRGRDILRRPAPPAEPFSARARPVNYAPGRPRQRQISRLQRDLDTRQRTGPPRPAHQHAQGPRATTLAREIATRRRSTPLSLALLDVDNFKNLNGTFGPPRPVTMRCATSREVVRSSPRPQDCVGPLRRRGSSSCCPIPTSIQRQRHRSPTAARAHQALLHCDNQRLLIDLPAPASHGSRTTEETAADHHRRADQCHVYRQAPPANRVFHCMGSRHTPTRGNGVTMPPQPAGRPCHRYQPHLRSRRHLIDSAQPSLQLPRARTTSITPIGAHRRVGDRTPLLEQLPAAERHRSDHHQAPAAALKAS